MWLLIDRVSDKLLSQLIKASVELRARSGLPAYDWEYEINILLDSYDCEHEFQHNQEHYEKMDLRYLVTELEEFAVGFPAWIREKPWNNKEEENKYKAALYKKFVAYMSETYGKSKNEVKKINKHKGLYDGFMYCLNTISDLEMWRYDKELHDEKVTSYYGPFKEPKEIVEPKELTVEYLNDDWFNEAVEKVIAVMRCDILFEYTDSNWEKFDGHEFISRILNKETGLYDKPADNLCKHYWRLKDRFDKNINKLSKKEQKEERKKRNKGRGGTRYYRKRHQEVYKKKQKQTHVKWLWWEIYNQAVKLNLTYDEFVKVLKAKGVYHLMNRNRFLAPIKNEDVSKIFFGSMAEKLGIDTTKDTGMKMRLWVDIFDAPDRLEVVRKASESKTCEATRDLPDVSEYDVYLAYLEEMKGDMKAWREHIERLKEEQREIDENRKHPKKEYFECLVGFK